MAFGEQAASLDRDLIQQLHGLSELSETLTLRLLEIEERIESLEKAHTFSENETGFATQALLDESEEKVKHLQNLLEKQTNKTYPSQLSAVENEGINNEEQTFSEQVDNESRCEIVDSIDEDSESLDDRREGFVETEYLDDPQIPLLSA